MSANMSFAPNDPIIARDLAYTDGKLVPEVGSSVAVCRCGRSRNKPLCDGSHRNIQPTWTDSNDAPAAVPDIDDIAGSNAPAKATSNKPSSSGGGGSSDNVEPTLAYIKALARDGLAGSSHGPMVAMGVPRGE